MGMGKFLIGAGVMIAMVGLILWAAERFLGRSGGFLPGDIAFRRGNFTFVFPIVTCIVLSVIFNLVLQFFAGRGGPR